MHADDINAHMDEDDFLLLSGIQHFVFCRRQWALIHLEQQWSDNLLTTEGGILHERAHEALQSGRRGDVITVRGMAISSPTLGLSGVCDVVEFHADENGVPLVCRRGTFRPVPVEYKRGNPKPEPCDEQQLCAQAICLEEMLVCYIPEGFLYYGQTRHRHRVAFSEELRKTVRQTAAAMHELYRRRHTPRVRKGPSCRSCSLKDLCLLRLDQAVKVSDYIQSRLEERDI